LAVLFKAFIAKELFIAKKLFKAFIAKEALEAELWTYSRRMVCMPEAAPLVDAVSCFVATGRPAELVLDFIGLGHFC
jgi:hypothetical protein